MLFEMLEGRSLLSVTAPVDAPPEVSRPVDAPPSQTPPTITMPVEVSRPERPAERPLPPVARWK
jgi:hypothetical protein